VVVSFLCGQWPIFEGTFTRTYIVLFPHLGRLL
jgi:hypothetical protein